MTLGQVTFDTATHFIGAESALSDRITVAQDRIDQFAAATDDFAWMHNDPARARRQSPYGGPISHGFLNLALVSPLARRAAIWPCDMGAGINYGLEGVRFTCPVPAGARIRGHFALKGCDERHDCSRLLRTGIVVEIEGAARPALVAEWLTLFYRRG